MSIMFSRHGSTCTVSRMITFSIVTFSLQWLWWPPTQHSITASLRCGSCIASRRRQSKWSSTQTVLLVTPTLCQHLQSSAAVQTPVFTINSLLSPANAACQYVQSHLSVCLHHSKHEVSTSRLEHDRQTDRQTDNLVSTISQQLIKGFSSNFGYRCIWVRRCAD